MASPPTGSPAGGSAAILLRRQYKQMQTDKDIPGISCGLVGDNIFEWEIMLMLDDEQDSLYGGGIFRARMNFPTAYPLLPPTLKFQTKILHPNIYENGEVCISILHPPEDDKYGYESASERWSPVQTPESILLSVISMLSSPNDESPANVEAATLFRNDKREFRKRTTVSEEEVWAYYPEGVQDIIGHGVSSFVGDLANGLVSKYPRVVEEKKEDIRHEAEIYTILGPHARILNYFGTASGGIRLQNAVNGAVHDYLRIVHVPTAKRLKWARQLAEAIEFVHEKGVNHGDISTRNCFLDEHLNLKLGDFQGQYTDSQGTIHEARSYAGVKSFRAAQHVQVP